MATDNFQYKSKDTITTELLAAWQSRFPDANTSSESVIRAWCEVWAELGSSMFASMRGLFQDLFVQTAGSLALERAGEQYGRQLRGGVKATGNLLFSGEGGTDIDVDTQVAAPQTASDALLFNVTASGTIPAPGAATAPTTSAGAAGNVTGTMEYAISFLTAAGETEIGAASVPLVVATKKVELAAIALGGPGTTGRKIYRRKNGGAWQFVHTLADNTTLIYEDNLADGSLGGAPLDESTAERITLSAEGADIGTQYNVGIGTITDISAASVDGLVDVINLAPFTGGAQEEDIEQFRSELTKAIRAPQSGTLADLESWATEVEGVESATAFKNDNLGTPTAGHVTIRIAGPGGAIPDSDVIAATADHMAEKDLANMTIHIAVFTNTVVNVAADLTLDSSYAIDDVRASVEAAINAYIQSVPIAGKVYVSGIVAAIFGLAGVLTVDVTTPSADVTITAAHRATMGTVTLT